MPYNGCARCCFVLEGKGTEPAELLRWAHSEVFWGRRRHGDGCMCRGVRMSQADGDGCLRDVDVRRRRGPRQS